MSLLYPCCFGLVAGLMAGRFWQFHFYRALSSGLPFLSGFAI